MADFASGLFVEPTDLNPVTFDTGDVKWSARRFASDGWLKCDAAAVSRTTYSDLFDALVPVLGVVTVTIASPGVLTLAGHALVIGDSVYLTTTGALPTGLTANTLFYVVAVPDANTFEVSATRGGAAVNTTGSQSGTHTLYYCPHGLGDGSTTFNVPDAPGRTLVAAAGASGHADVRVQGQNEGIALAFRRPKHRHTVTQNATNAAGGTGAPGGSEGTTFSPATITVGADPTNDPLDQPANLVLNLFIKT